MTASEKIIDTMRKIATDSQAPRIEIGKYKDGGIVTDDYTLTADMVYKPDYLTEKRAKKVSGTISTSGGESHTHTFTDTSEYIEPIKNDDLVAFYEINPSKFLILCKVV